MNPLHAHSNMTGARRQARRRPLYSASGRVVAVLAGGVLTKTVTGSRHFLRKPPAIALDAGAVAQAEALGVNLVRITDRETGHIYRASIGDLRAHGWLFDRGYGEQIAMRLTRWHRDGEKKPQPNREPEREPGERVKQLDLF